MWPKVVGCGRDRRGGLEPRVPQLGLEDGDATERVERVDDPLRRVFLDQHFHREPIRILQMYDGR